MSAHQMICHLGDSSRMATGEKAVTPVHMPLPPMLIKWIALYLPLRWRAGIPTSRELDQSCDGTKPTDFAADLAEAAALLERIAGTPKGFRWPAHPAFGRMSQADWLRWAYLHTDHHLRQFGA